MKREIVAYISAQLTNEEADIVDDLLYNRESPYFKMARSDFIRTLIVEEHKRMELKKWVILKDL